MNKIKLLQLFFFVVLTSFVCQQDDIDKLDVKINNISYTPQLFGQVYAEKGKIFERFKLTLTNTGATDSSVNFKESFISDKDDNRYYFYYGKNKCTIKPNESVKCVVYYKFLEDATPKYIILGGKVFVAEVNQKEE